MTGPPRFHRYQFADVPASVRKPVLRLEDMSWEERFVAAWLALCTMECRAESAEVRVKQLEEQLRVARHEVRNRLV